MNPAFLGSRLFTSEMPRFLHKIGQTYGENGLQTPFLSDSFYLGHFHASWNQKYALIWDLACLQLKSPFFNIKWLRLMVKMDWKRHFYQIPSI